MKKIGLFLMSSVLLVASGIAPVKAETVVCTVIDSLPYTISTQGVYCLTSHLNTGITAGSAITIAANNVVLDLNGYKIGGLSAGLGTQTYGIYASQRQNITIKNGTVRGFLYGIYLNDSPPYTTSLGHVIEDIRADQNTYVAIMAGGLGNIFRNNQAVATGGSTAYGANAEAYGIVAFGPGGRLLNNDVANTKAQGSAAAAGIYMHTTSDSIVAGNRVGYVTAGTGDSYGLYLYGGSDFIVRDNSISSADFGIIFEGSTGTYINNVVRNTLVPYGGGTAAGTTNY